MIARRARYGIDAPTVPSVFALCVVVSGVAVVVSFLTGSDHGAAVGPAVPLVLFTLFLVTYLHSTWRGKFAVWEDLLDEAGLAPDARVLDLGCGRGAVLVAAARRLGPGGRAEGIDLWRSVDQSGNNEQTALANAVVEGVAERVTLHTGDLRALPFEDDSFDVVLSSLAIHNIKAKAERDQAALEALRVLRPGGRLAMVDLPAGKGYLELLAGKLENSRMKAAGWRMWWGGPFYASTVLTGVKASDPADGTDAVETP